jgi:DNA-binding Xre family transcriptional regulator
MTMRVGEAVRLRILELCRERELSVNMLSALCGMTQSTLNNIVSGRNSTTTVSTVQKICDGLEITILDFFTSPLFENLEQEIK